MTRERLQAMREADEIFSEKEKLKAQKIKDDGRKLKEFNAAQMVMLKLLSHHLFVAMGAKKVSLHLSSTFQIQAERRAREQQLRRDEYQFVANNAELMAEEDSKFREYSQQVINAAIEAQQNVFPLIKAAREGCGGLGPVYSGARPSYLVQDSTGAQMPKYTSGVTQSIKKLHEAVNFEDAKRRLGFTW